MRPCSVVTDVASFVRGDVSGPGIFDQARGVVGAAHRAGPGAVKLKPQLCLRGAAKGDPGSREVITSARRCRHAAASPTPEASRRAGFRRNLGHCPAHALDARELSATTQLRGDLVARVPWNRARKERVPVAEKWET
jgi:hypothetical protein